MNYSQWKDRLNHNIFLKGQDMSKDKSREDKSREDLTLLEREHILKVCADYHYRNGIKQPDGSNGVIRITHKELANELTKMYIQGSKV